MAQPLTDMQLFLAGGVVDFFSNRLCEVAIIEPFSSDAGEIVEAPAYLSNFLKGGGPRPDDKYMNSPDAEADCVAIFSGEFVGESSNRAKAGKRESPAGSSAEEGDHGRRESDPRQDSMPLGQIMVLTTTWPNVDLPTLIYEELELALSSAVVLERRFVNLRSSHYWETACFQSSTAALNGVREDVLSGQNSVDNGGEAGFSRREEDHYHAPPSSSAARTWGGRTPALGLLGVNSSSSTSRLLLTTLLSCVQEAQRKYLYRDHYNWRIALDEMGFEIRTGILTILRDPRLLSIETGVLETLLTFLVSSSLGFKFPMCAEFLECLSDEQIVDLRLHSDEVFRSSRHSSATQDPGLVEEMWLVDRVRRGL